MDTEGSGATMLNRMAKMVWGPYEYVGLSNINFMGEIMSMEGNFVSTVVGLLVASWGNSVIYTDSA